METVNTDLARADVGEAATSRWRALRDPMAFAGVTLAACSYIWLRNPNTSTVFPACPFKAVTGLDCPGCGATRAVYSLMHGDLAGAASHNLLFVIALPVIIYALVRWTLGRLGYQLPMVKFQPWMLWVAVPVLLLFEVVRNLHGPTAWLDAA